MADVNSRATARIPIVMFEDSASQVECDISVHNELAARNTQLLRTCSMVTKFPPSVISPRTTESFFILLLPSQLLLAFTDKVAARNQIDPRVRWLAYTLKRWVKARHLNDPSDGTLSSYGLVLLLFSFLQVHYLHSFVYANCRSLR
jgi:terminal uridylyltransferase